MAEGVAGRFDIYKVPHKAQRRALFLTAVAIGRLNAGDDATAAALATRIHQLISHLRDHSSSEDRYIGALLENDGGMPPHIAEGHHKVEALMDAVENGVRTGALSRTEHTFYRLFNRLVSAYVSHMDDEEALQADVLWPRFTDEQLIEAQARFVTQRSPMSNLSDLAFILPSLNVAEICEFLGTIRRDVPGEPFGMVLAVARKTLDPPVWSAVESHLANW